MADETETNITAELIKKKGHRVSVLAREYEKICAALDVCREEHFSPSLIDDFSTAPREVQDTNFLIAEWIDREWKGVMRERFISELKERKREIEEANDSENPLIVQALKGENP